MKTSMTHKQIGLAVACALTLGFVSSAANAQNFGPNDLREDRDQRLDRRRHQHDRGAMAFPGLDGRHCVPMETRT